MKSELWFIEYSDGFTEECEIVREHKLTYEEWEKLRKYPWRLITGPAMAREQDLRIFSAVKIKEREL